MTPRPDQRRSPRTVKLAGGRTVRVSYFSADPPAPRPPEGPPPQRDPEHCPACASDLVYPIDWDDAGASAYWLTLRCPNCERTETGTYEWEAVQRLDQRLDDGERALMADLYALTRANVEEDFDRVIAALRAGHVWPMDF